MIDKGSEGGGDGGGASCERELLTEEVSADTFGEVRRTFADNIMIRYMKDMLLGRPLIEAKKCILLRLICYVRDVRLQVHSRGKQVQA